MRTLRTAWATAAVAIVTAGTVVALPANAVGKPDRDHAICKSRACLLVLQAADDKDGDGVADVDELVLATDPGDAAIVPDADKLMDLLLKRELPSFERHLSEIVMLPTLTPDGSAIATGLGEFDLRDGDGDLLKSIGIVINETGRNGFDAIFGFRVMAADAPPTYPFGDAPLSSGSGVGPDPGPTAEELRFAAWMALGDVALYSNGTRGGITDFGHNAGKSVAGETLGSDGKPFITYDKDGTVTKTYDVGYTDGSSDNVTHSVSPDGTRTQTVLSKDADGNNVGVGYVREKSWTESDGTKVRTLEYSRPVRDANGKVTGTQLVEVRQEKKGDTTTTTTKTTTTTNEGKQTVDITKTVEKPDVDPECDADCQDEIDTEAGGDDYVDPDYIGFNVITPEDLARVEFRLKQVGQPGPDDGSTGEHELDSGTFGKCWPDCTGDPLVVLLDPDGVTVIAAGEPNFTRWVQPDYDPWVQEMAGMANQKVPVNGDDNPNTDGS